MKAHFKRKHEGKTYDCEQCDKKFSTIHAKKSHVNAQHSNGKPFQCNTCNKKCTARHEMLEKKPFIVQFCFIGEICGLLFQLRRRG